MSPPDTVLPNSPVTPAPTASRPPHLKRVLFVTDFYLEEVLLGVVEFAREANWDLIANMRFHGVFPSDAQADGIIATAITGRVTDWLADHSHWPIVRMLATTCGELPYPTVEVDYYLAGKMGARHLLQLGHTEFAIYWMHEIDDAHAIRRGFLEETGSRNVHLLSMSEAFPGKIVADVPRDQRQAWLIGELQRLPKPIAIMGDDDRRALEVLRACDAIGLRVPEDVAIIGCDNHAVELGLARIPLSSVQVDFRAVGYTAAAMLHQVMAGERISHEPVRIAPRGIAARQSTATFVTDAPGITAAVLFLREHFQEPLRIEQLARIAGVSKRVFETQFRHYVGCSAREEIHRARLACAARLLRDTDFKLDAVAIESGFGSGKYLSAAFTKYYGVGPSAWRQQQRST